MTQLRNIHLISPVKTKPAPSPEILKGNKEYVGPSKGEMKRQMDRLQELGQRLVELPAGKLARIEIPEKLRDAVVEARRITALGARRRQIQFIGRIMEEFDATAIARNLRDIDLAPNFQSVAAIAEDVESITIAREVLTGGDEVLFEMYGAEFESAVLSEMRRAARQTHKNIASGKNSDMELAILAQKFAKIRDQSRVIPARD